MARPLCWQRGSYLPEPAIYLPPLGRARLPHLPGNRTSSCALVWSLSSKSVSVCVRARMGVGFNHTTRQDPPPLVWRENAPHVGSPVRSPLPRSCQGARLPAFRLTAPWLCFSSANRRSRVRRDHSFNLFDKRIKFVPNSHFNRKEEQFVKEKEKHVSAPW